MAAEDVSPAQNVEVISPQEAQLRVSSGGFTASGQPAPEAAMVDTSQGPVPQQGPPAPAKPTGPAPAYYSAPSFAEQEAAAEEAKTPKGKKPKEPAPKAAPAAERQEQPAVPAYYSSPSFADQEPEPLPPVAMPAPSNALGHRIGTLLKGAGSFGAAGLEWFNRAASTPAMLVDKLDSWYMGHPQTTAQDFMFQHFVDPAVAARQQMDLPPDADFLDKLLHGIGGTAAMIGAALATGGAAEAPAAEAGIAGVATRASAGAAQMSAPAAVAALDVGNRVYEATGDAKAAAVAGSTAYVINAAQGAIPMTVGGNVATRIATGAAIGPILGEASREAQNAALPPELRQPFSTEDSLVQVATGAMFGLLPGHAVPELREQPTTAMDLAQQAAAQEALAKGGDALDATVAATHANAALGEHHDAVAYETHMQMNKLEAARQEAEVQAQEQEQFEKEHGQEMGFRDLAERREAEAATQREADYPKALNQKGEQEAAEAANLHEANEAGTAGAEKPTLADTLSPEQLKAFQSLKERRTAQMGEEPTGETPDEEKFMPYVEPAKPPETLQERRETEGAQPVAEEAPAEERLPPEERDAEIARLMNSPSTEAADIQADMKSGKLTPEEGRQRLEDLATRMLRGTDFAENNASGESRASLESIRRFNQEQTSGQTRHLIDPDGNVTDLTSPTDVDRQAPKGSVVYQRGIGIQDRGGLPASHANGLVERARAQGFDTAARPTDLREGGPGQSETARQIYGARAVARPRLTGDQVRTALKPLTDKVGGAVQIHDDHTTLPQKNLDDAAARGIAPENIKGLYDLDTDQAHIVAGAHTDPEVALRTAVHEVVGHQGMYALLGDDFAGTMRDIYRNIHDGPLPEGFRKRSPDAETPSDWMRDYMRQHNFDPRNAQHRMKTAAEYVAHLAERDVGDAEQEHPTVLRRAIDAVRAGLRKLGFVREWTDNDIRALLRKSANNLESEHALAAKEYRGKGTDFSTEEDPRVEQLHPSNPLAMEHKFGMTVEEQSHGQGYVKSRLDFLRDSKDWVADQVDKSIGARLGFIHMRNLPDFIRSELMPSLKGFIRMHDDMVGRRGQLMKDPAQKFKDWSSWATKNKDLARTLGDLMHSSTLAGVDVSKDFLNRYTDAQHASDPVAASHDALRKDYYDAARRQWRSLDDQGRQLYQDVRDHYVGQRNKIYDALNQRISESGADEKSKKAAMSMLRKTFESSRVHGPYFPLMRYGDRWAYAKDKNGNTVSFSRFESRAEHNAWMKNMADQGYEVKGGKKMDSKAQMEGIDPKFVEKIMNIEGLSKDLKDEIWQTYLQAMPEMSMRKQFIHRAGRLGYTMDAMRNYANSAFHGAHQIARLEYGHRLDSLMDSMRQEADNVSDVHRGTADADWAPELAKEMGQRYEWLKNPRASPLASTLTQMGFGWYLGAAPATAFRILSQNPMIAQPVLAGYEKGLGGGLRATKELTRATAQWATSRGNLADRLRGDERAAFDIAADRGVFSTTYTQTLATGANDGLPPTGKLATAMRIGGYLFNAAEHHNRMTTYLAGYRLARQAGLSHEAAIDRATDVTWDSHFDYTNANRPRYLQNNVAKVVGLFKQYPWGVTYRLARDAKNLINSNLPADERMRAGRTLAGMLTRVSLMAGATGLPLMWVATGVINAVMHDKDRPFDAEAEARAYLQQQYGRRIAEAVMTGPIGSMTGASLSGGASYNDLWYKPPSRDENARDTAMDAVGQLGGALLAVPLNMVTGGQMMADGQIERGVEHFLPPEGAALLKALRYSQEGATNLQGETIIPRKGTPEGDAAEATGKDVLDDKDIFTQALGFTPQKIATQYALNTNVKNAEAKLQARKRDIENTIARRAEMGDEEKLDEIMQEMVEFNSKNPTYAIDGKGLASSMKNHYMHEMESENGVYLPRGLGSLRDQYDPQPEQPENGPESP